MDLKNYAIILAGGNGSRLGSDTPKQYLHVGGKMIIEYCLETIAAHHMITGIQIVAADEWQYYISGFIESEGEKLQTKYMGFSEPGRNRQESILHALLDIGKIAKTQDCVMIHDAARPLLKPELISTCLEYLNKPDAAYDGVMPVLPMKDTVYMSKDGKAVSMLLDREQIFAGQAPEFFRYGRYLKANQILWPDEILSINGSTEPAIMAGMNIAMVLGDEDNFKITTMTDLERFREIIKTNEQQ